MRHVRSTALCSSLAGGGGPLRQRVRGERLWLIAMCLVGGDDMRQ